MKSIAPILQLERARDYEGTIERLSTPLLDLCKKLMGRGISQRVGGAWGTIYIPSSAEYTKLHQEQAVALILFQIIESSQMNFLSKNTLSKRYLQYKTFCEKYLFFLKIMLLQASLSSSRSKFSQ